MPDVIDRLNAALTGRYVVERELGEGGMATVYAAHDVRHDRMVAIKVLRPELAAVIGAERFLAEIRTTAHLQHPHILPLFDSGEADTFLFYVMPLLEGDSLRERIAREHQLPVDEAVRIAKAVAGALDYAHRNGVIHRDIKPANILLQDGEPVLADFGIALAVSTAGGGRLTETGLSLGTPSYMSPEQATAERDPGPASDVYSLGCVLYEMLTGEPPFTGSSAQAILGKIVVGNPTLVTEHRPTVPAHVEAVVLRALEKIPADRYATAGAFAAALDDVTGTHPRQSVAAGGAPGGARRRWISQRASQVAVAIAVLALAWAGFATLRPANARPAGIMSVRIQLPRGQAGFRDWVLSPDGSRIAWTLTDTADTDARTRTSRLWTRRWSEPRLTAVPGTEGASTFAFSPDGTHVAFMANGDLKSVALDGSSPVTLVSGADFGSLDWGPDGFIYGSYGATDKPAVSRVPEGGGTVEKVSHPEDGRADRGPFVLPGGRGVLFTSIPFGGALASDSVGVLNLATGKERLIAAGLTPRFVDPGYLVYLSPQGQLMAAPFDPVSLQVTASPTVVADSVRVFTTSEAGDLLYVEGRTRDRVPEVVWLGPASAERAIDWRMTPGPLPTGPRLSPDGSRLALVLPKKDTLGRLVVRDLSSGIVTPILGGADEGFPAWSANGRDVVFLSRRGDGRWRFWRRRADASGEPVALSAPLSDRLVSTLGFWSPDQPIVMSTDSGLVALRLGKDSVPTPLLDDGLRHLQPTLSHDGRWMAFAADVSGTWRIFVRPFPDVDSALVQVSSNGGEACAKTGIGYCVDMNPRWSRDGHTLYYTTAVPDGLDLVAARVRTTPGFSVVSREHVAPLQRGFIWHPAGWLYDVASDGRVVDVRWQAQQSTIGGVVLVKNFREELREKLKGARR